MEDSRKNYLNSSSNLEGEEREADGGRRAVVVNDSLICHILALDVTLQGNEEIHWLRKELFRLYNLAQGVDIDYFCGASPPGRIESREGEE